MSLSELKKNIAGGEIPPVLLFCAKDYPIIFFNLVKKLLKASFFDVENNSFEQLQTILFMSFLGNKTTTFINLSSLPDSKQARYIDFIKKYQGPNSIICFAGNSENYDNVIDLDEEIKKDKNVIARFLNLSIPKLSNAYNVSLDEQIILSYYFNCLGQQKKEFEDKWLNKIIKPEASLFDLTTYFFSKNKTEFFSLWLKLETVYSDMFWISFWSEQIYRAHFYVYYRKHNNLAEARKVSYKLPFSFTQKDWRFADLKSLSKAHKIIYDLDYDLKNGASNIRLDLFFASYFAPII